MAITTTNPITVNAVYDKVWFSRIEIVSSNLNAEPRADVQLVLYRTKQDGTNEANPATAKRFTINNLFTLAAQDQDVANAMGALFIALEKQAKAKNLI
jgi:hypothetical protein